MLQTGHSGRLVKTVLQSNALFSLMKALFAIVLAFFFGFLILLITKSNPIEAYSALFQGAFGSRRGIGETFLSTTPLIFGGLGFALAYRCKLFNIGLEGQIAVGNIVQSYCDENEAHKRHHHIWKSKPIESHERKLSN